MARHTQQEFETLEHLLNVARNDLASLLADPRGYPIDGCGDHSCLVAHATGMATNGGCRCNERTFRRAVQWWRRYARFLESTVAEQRDEMARMNSRIVELEVSR